MQTATHLILYMVWRKTPVIVWRSRIWASTIALRRWGIIWIVLTNRAQRLTVCAIYRRSRLTLVV